MYAHRQIYDHVQDSVPVPESMRHQRVEVIFISLTDNQPVLKTKKRVFGSAKGLIKIADDFDEPLQDFVDYQ
ncbi:MAG TPA: DUF2281 domain-containing protein [Agitococcus sp.]|nr:DUF2281 domain-containing protein [Pseudomonadales bacterium]MCB1673350.1 DUF2281 domain-containing protein [Pseudomonadales bacterium]HQV22525.1 DUF2281 domain-containing protein [Agitococcus sp.]